MGLTATGREQWPRVKRELEEQGWRCEVKDGHHWNCYAPDGQTIVRLDPTSTEPRSFKNALSQLKRAGYVDSTAPPPKPVGTTVRAIGSHVILPPEFPHEDAPDMVGTYWRRTDRLDPRDPKMIASYNPESGEVKILDRRGRTTTTTARLMARGIRDHVLVQVDPADAVKLPDVTGAPFPEALRAIREADRSSQEDLASLLGDRGLTGAAVGHWENGVCAPVRKHYDQLIELWPSLRAAEEPDWKRPNHVPQTGPRDSEPEPEPEHGTRISSPGEEPEEPDSPPASFELAQPGPAPASSPTLDELVSIHRAVLGWGGEVDVALCFRAGGGVSLDIESRSFHGMSATECIMNALEGLKESVEREERAVAAKRELLERGLRWSR